MTRVSENSNVHALKYSIARAKRKMEDLQLKGSSLKRMVKPSDDPIGNVDLLSLRSRKTDNNQYKRNVNYAQAFLEFTENAVSDLTDIIIKAKEIAVAQASDTFNPQVRKNVAKEVEQLRKQALAIGNKRLGSKYIFSGFATHQRPFDQQGKYSGDNGHSFIEVSKDFFIPVNITGHELFFAIDKIESINDDPLSTAPDIKVDAKVEDIEKDNIEKAERDIASEVSKSNEDVNKRESIFDQLFTLENALRSGSSDAIQNLLEGLDDSLTRLISLRTKIGSVSSSVVNSETGIDNDNLNTENQKSKIADADIAELFSDIEKQKNILQATYKSSGNLIDRSLIDFIR